LWRVGSRLHLKRAHNPKVVGSNPTPATMNDEGLADAAAPLTPFVYPDFTQELVCRRPARNVFLGDSRRRGEGHDGVSVRVVGTKIVVEVDILKATAEGVGGARPVSTVRPGPKPKTSSPPAS